MSKIYTDLTEFERAQEREFREKVEEIAYYQGNVERTTLDGEWTESELKDDLYDTALKVLNGDKNTKGWLEKNKFKALKDPDLVTPEAIVEFICNKYDMIEVYNRAYDLHRNDKPMMFGIHYFDELALGEVNKTLRENLVSI